MRCIWARMLLKRRFFGLLIAVVAAGMLLLVFFLGSDRDNYIAVSSEITNWGLSFSEEGEAPIGNASSEALAEYNAFYIGAKEEKTIYLTFDAGYENGYTESILETLKKHEVSASFFLVGDYFENEPELVKRMVEDGHVVGNHTWTHPDMSKILDEKSFEEELKLVEDKYFEITGSEMPKLYRPPQGKYCKSNLEMAKEMGYSTVFWSLAYVDWINDEQPTKEEAFSKLIPRIHDGAVLLLHSTSKTNCEILDELIIKYKEMGYEFGDIRELIF